MKIYTSYLYQIRFMKPYMIPLSTAVWDPKWFHNDSRDHSIIFKDKNGVYNGLRDEDFVPGDLCKNDCRGIDSCEIKDPSKCNFLIHYRQQLDHLNIGEILNSFNELCEHVRDTDELTEDPVIMLIVYETPLNKCSERRVIQEWFHDNGIEVDEFDPKSFNN